jgi:hypothetical protein
MLTFIIETKSGYHYYANTFIIANINRKMDPADYDTQIIAEDDMAPPSHQPECYNGSSDDIARFSNISCIVDTQFIGIEPDSNAQDSLTSVVEDTQFDFLEPEAQHNTDNVQLSPEDERFLQNVASSNPPVINPNNTPPIFLRRPEQVVDDIAENFKFTTVGKRNSYGRLPGQKPEKRNQQPQIFPIPSLKYHKKHHGMPTPQESMQSLPQDMTTPHSRVSSDPTTMVLPLLTAQLSQHRSAIPTSTIRTNPQSSAKPSRRTSSARRPDEKHAYQPAQAQTIHQKVHTSSSQVPDDVSPASVPQFTPVADANETNRQIPPKQPHAILNTYMSYRDIPSANPNPRAHRGFSTKIVSHKQTVKQPFPDVESNTSTKRHARNKTSQDGPVSVLGQCGLQITSSAEKVSMQLPDIGRWSLRSPS